MPLNHKGHGRVRDSVAVGGADRLARRRIADLLSGRRDGYIAWWIAERLCMSTTRLQKLITHPWFETDADGIVTLTDAGRENGLEANDDPTT